MKTAGLTVINVYNCWLARWLVPLRCHGHYMWEYTGQNDCTRVSATEWAEAEYKKALAKITTTPFTTFDAEMQPHTVDNPGPTTWHEVADHLPQLAGEDPEEKTIGEEENAEEEEEEAAAGEEEDEDDDERTESETEPTASGPVGRASRTQVQAEDVAEANLRTCSGDDEGVREEESCRVESGEEVVDGARGGDDAWVSAPPEKEVAAHEEAPPEAGAGAADTGVGGAAREPAEGRPEAEAQIANDAARRASSERRSKHAADPSLAKRSLPLVAETEKVPLVEGAMPASPKALSAEAARMGEEEVNQGGLIPLPSWSFVELHHVLGVVHAREQAEAKVEIKRLNADHSVALKKNRQLIAISKEREKILAQVRVGYLPEAEVASRIADLEAQVKNAQFAKKRAKSEVTELTEVLEVKNKELEDVVEVQKDGLAEALRAKDKEMADAAATHTQELEALKKMNVADLERERNASAQMILGLQKEKSDFEAFVRENCRQILGADEFEKPAIPTECMRAMSTCILKSAPVILAVLQYMSPRERLQHDAQSIFEAILDVPAVVD
ncbi:hypothetical protein ACQ4PT_020381 [Festuca glaucescens]